MYICNYGSAICISNVIYPIWLKETRYFVSLLLELIFLSIIEVSFLICLTYNVLGNII